MNPLYVKALHIIFVVTWFAGLFYIVRLFIYLKEAQGKPEPDKKILSVQFILMQKRLWYGITWPGGILAAIFGIWLFLLNSTYFLTQPWMHLKLTFVVGLIFYHWQCHRIFKQQSKGKFTWTSMQLRLFNEAATVFLFTIVFIVVVKSSGTLIYTALITIFVILTLLLGVYLYKLDRERKEKEGQ
jgi:putative membrane protein